MELEYWEEVKEQGIKLIRGYFKCRVQQRNHFCCACNCCMIVY
jgi:hypothetical protein